MFCNGFLKVVKYILQRKIKGGTAFLGIRSNEKDNYYLTVIIYNVSGIRLCK